VSVLTFGGFVEVIGRSERLGRASVETVRDAVPVRRTSVENILSSVLHFLSSDRLIDPAELLGGPSVPNIEYVVQLIAKLVQDNVRSDGTCGPPEPASRPDRLPLWESVVHKPDEGRLLLFRHVLETGQPLLDLPLPVLIRSDLGPGHPEERHGCVFDDVEIGGPEVSQVSHEKMMVLARPPLFGLAEGDEVALVELEVGATEGDAVVEGEAVVDLDRGVEVRSGSARGAVRVSLEVCAFDATPGGAADGLVGAFEVVMGAGDTGGGHGEDLRRVNRGSV